MRVAIASAESEPTERETKLSVRLNLPIVERPSLNANCDIDFLLAYVDSRLLLQRLAGNEGGSLCVDFADAKLNYRAKSSIRSQNIAKALGIKGENRPTVLDATAGLGKDAFLLASLGCEVALLERSALVHALLFDGLSRNGSYGKEVGAVLDRMDLRFGDFLEMEAEPRRFDVVYLDPMFPHRRKSAKVKKDMALLQQLLGHQQDGLEMLEHGLQIAKKRVVVKRAKLAPHLSAAKPDIEFKGSSSRYDVYLVTKQRLDD